MTRTVEPTSPALEDLLAVVAERRAEFTALRDIPRDVMEKFRAAGVYRAATPKMFGGDALPPRQYLRMVERIAEVDGSAGWMASIEVAKIYLAALPLETQAKLYSTGPDVVFAGGLFPMQPAEREPGGFKVSGQWRFASGCTSADILAVGIRTEDDKARMAVLPAEDVEIVENWDVVGMEGTGSHDLRINGVVVPDEWTFLRGGRANVDEPLHRYPAVPYAAQALAAVNLGIARAALDHLTQVGAGRTGLTGAAQLADRPYARIAVGKAEAALRSARAFFYEVTDEVYATVTSGTPASVEQASSIRLAAAHAAAVSFDVVRTAYSLADISAISSGHPLQRHLRDASVVPHHALLTEGVYDGAGAVLMGVKPAPGYV
ncbi:flavin-dependent monooxygenase [Lentzea tibetensis]|uniref:Flavin-dependent monooxygenase n=1 Tax=Lentzea tibetensis TaxID=2591470 RepID=A0A563ESA8_9PSEU|nr:acyl-CoA dehydrogenase family protein [Lentzea tibetensis]TWP50549.1 flavin-dependent monooxygenase [Lentzea tibetensis]